MVFSPPTFVLFFYVPSARRKLGLEFEGFSHTPFGIFFLCSQCKKEIRVRVLRGLFNPALGSFRFPVKKKVIRVI